MNRVLRELALASAIYLTISIGSAVAADCIDIKQANISFEGTLTYHIFPGPPEYEDVRKGDAPEPTYILKLDNPICATGDEFLDQRNTFDQIQVFPDSDKAVQALGRDLRRLVGQRVHIDGTGAFGRHTGHHHAPLMVPISRISVAYGSNRSDRTPLTTVEAFYIALGAGNGEEATRFVIPEKRSAGPLSATVITGFYSGLVEPLTLVDVIPIRSDEYRVRYTYVAPGRRRCDGESLVRTVNIGGLNLIASIKAINGC